MSANFLKINNCGVPTPHLSPIYRAPLEQGVQGGFTPCKSERTGGRQGVILVVFFAFQQCFSKNMAVFLILVEFFFTFRQCFFKNLVVLLAFRQCFFKKSGSVLLDFFSGSVHPLLNLNLSGALAHITTYGAHTQSSQLHIEYHNIQYWPFLYLIKNQFYSYYTNFQLITFKDITLNFKCYVIKLFVRRSNKILYKI